MGERATVEKQWTDRLLKEGENYWRWALRVGIDSPLQRVVAEKIRAAEAAARRETLQACIKVASDADPGKAKVPAKSRSIWADSNYMSGWRQTQTAIVRALRDLEDPDG